MIKIKTPIDILIVDDEKDFVEMLSLRLQHRGHRARVAFSGEEGLEALAAGPVDVVVLDIRMPGMDGITALKAIKADYPLTEVVLLTGHGAVETAVEGMKAGAFDYLLKPAQFDDLLEILENARARKEEHEERMRKAEARALLRRSGDV
jgi:DNA-binding NtrC family response regulator